MPTKESIKRELDFSRNMSEILEVMKQMAQAQFTASKRVSVSTFGGLVVSFDRIFELMLAVPKTHPLIKSQSNVYGIIVCTSDQAFMGALNSKIAKKARQTAEEGGQCLYLPCGRKGALKFKFAKEPYVGFQAIKDSSGMKTLSTELADFAVKQFVEKRMGKLFVVSAESNSFGSQVVRATQLLPFEDLVKKYEIFKNKKKLEGQNLIISESESKPLAEFTARLWVRNALYYLFMNNKPAEFSALASQMEGSCESVKKVIGKLSTLYKRARNEKIDASMREIFVSTMVNTG